MTLKTVRCGHCDKEMFILEQFVRETMFCTIGKMEKYNTYISSLCNVK